MLNISPFLKRLFCKHSFYYQATVKIRTLFGGNSWMCHYVCPRCGKNKYN